MLSYDQYRTLGNLLQVIRYLDTDGLSDEYLAVLESARKATVDLLAEDDKWFV